MTSTIKAFAIFTVATLIAGATQALETTQIAAADSPGAQRRHPPVGQAEMHGDNAMQALCREVLVDTDEGYGVTNREARVICDDLQ